MLREPLGHNVHVGDPTLRGVLGTRLTRELRNVTSPRLHNGCRGFHPGNIAARKVLEYR
ncbi:hypothetical protein [Streptomyces sp. GS7]|uniref:hypothetical protein n=1 Tax=Streptomyces sp. GS7 TaxID=2692234 RepID=UPI001318E7CD|nr:hypothetical protein [Streptomyces sp. GS7]QHC22920.1 hypothetical protein GR130_17300 [Streptomyces sp. GS7]